MSEGVSTLAEQDSAGLEAKVSLCEPPSAATTLRTNPSAPCLPSRSMSLCICGTVRDKRVAGQTSKFPGRSFFACGSCGKFDWADQPGHIASAAGPVCECGKASVQRAVKKEGPNKGRKFWSCAMWPQGCTFFEFQEAASPAPSQTPPAAAGTPTPAAAP